MVCFDQQPSIHGNKSMTYLARRRSCYWDQVGLGTDNVKDVETEGFLGENNNKYG